MSFAGLHKWNPKYMKEHGLTEADLLRDIYKTRSQSALIIVSGFVAFGFGFGLLLLK